MEDPDIPALLAVVPEPGSSTPIETGDASYFLSTIEPVVGDEPGMARWRKRLFVATAAVTADAANYFGLPRDRTVVLGTRIEV
jgi:KUP system potassium uptake protein